MGREREMKISSLKNGHEKWAMTTICSTPCKVAVGGVKNRYFNRNRYLRGKTTFAPCFFF